MPSDATIAPLAAAPARRAGNPALRRVLRHRLALFGAVTILVLVLLCAFGPHLLPYDDLYIDLRARFAPPAEQLALAL